MPKKEPQNPLNIIVLYSAGHLGSAVVLNKLLNNPDVNIMGVVKAQALNLSFKERKKLRQHFKKVGWKFGWLLVWQRMMQAIAFSISSLLPFLRRRLKPAWKIAIDNNIPVFHCKNINDEACLNFIKKLEPDLLISAYFSQILKTEIIQSPKIGVLNIHPGTLPSYKGAMAYFWVLKNNTDKGGVTVHWIDEGIDTGEMLAQRSFTIHKKATQETVLLYTAVIGSALLKRIIPRLLKGETIHAIEHAQDLEDQYYSMPSAKDFDEYFKNRRFFRIRDIFGLIFTKRI